MSSRPKLSRIYWPAVFFQICPGDENSSWCLKEKSGRPFSSSFSWYFLIPFYSEGKGAGHVCCADTHITHKLAGSPPQSKVLRWVVVYSEGFSSPQLPDVARPSVRPRCVSAFCAPLLADSIRLPAESGPHVPWRHLECEKTSRDDPDSLIKSDASMCKAPLRPHTAQTDDPGNEIRAANVTRRFSRCSREEPPHPHP
jgi:hypothetical protein